MGEGGGGRGSTWFGQGRGGEGQCMIWTNAMAGDCLSPKFKRKLVFLFLFLRVPDDVFGNGP